MNLTEMGFVCSTCGKWSQQHTFVVGNAVIEMTDFTVTLDCGHTGTYNIPPDAVPDPSRRGMWDPE